MNPVPTSDRSSAPYRRDGRSRLVGLLLLAAALGITCAVYLPHIGNTFAGLDLVGYKSVIDSDDYRGTTASLLTDFKGRLVPGYYAPIGSITLMTDKLLSRNGLPSPRVTLTINLLLHCLVGILIFALLTVLRAPPLVKGLTVFIFLVHPVQVPSILWFAERKTVLSAVFYMTSYICFCKYRQGGPRYLWAICLGSFAIALLTKPPSVVLPVVLLVSEVLLFSSGRNLAHDVAYSSGIEWKAVAALLPFFLLSLAFALITMKTEAAVNISFPIIHRPFAASSALWFYVAQVVAPFNLMYIYPQWQVDLSDPLRFLPLSGLILVAVAAFRYRARIATSLRWGTANFLIPLLPVIGIVKFGYLDYSFVGDHFLYLSMFGASFVIADISVRLWERTGRALKPLIAMGVIVFLAISAIQTWRHTATWSSPLALWSDNAKRCPDCWVAEKELGVALFEQGRYAPAIDRLKRAIELNPGIAQSYNDLGLAYRKTGDLKHAAESFNRAVQLQPLGARPYNNLGVIALDSGDTEEAIRLFRKAVSLEPRFDAAHYNLGLAYEKARDPSQAAIHFHKALWLNPGSPEALNKIGLLKLTTGAVGEAVAHFRKALSARSNSPEIHLNLGNALLASGDRHGAIDQYKKAVELRPDYAAGHRNLGAALLMEHKSAEAIPSLNKALQFHKNSPDLLNLLGVAYSQQGDTAAARGHFQEALKIDPNHKGALENLKLLEKSGAR